MTEPTARCPICRGPARVHRTAGVPIYACRRCRTRFLLEDAPAPVADPEPDGDRRAEATVEALEQLRREAASKIIDTIGSLRGGRGGRLLDVGCSYGWFLEAAERRGWDARGIEPDQVTARRATQAGRTVELGRFPDDLEDAAPFDVITFNDVFEHLRCPREILRECGVRLTPGGLVVLNMPSTRGPIYHLSEAAAAAGFVGPLRRMFQLPFAYPVPCPHLFYYGREGVARLARDASFRVVHRHGLPIVSWSTAKSRVGLDTTLTGTPGTVQLLGLCALVPAVRLWPSKDIEVHYLSKVS